MKSQFPVFLGGLLLATAVSAKDTSDRYIIIHNDMPNTVYPVVESPENGNCKPGSTSVNRIVLPNGVASKKTIKIYMPDKCWYNAGRVLIFTPNIEAFENRIDSNQRTQKGSAAVCNEVKPDKTDGAAVDCYKGSAVASYPLDSPAQLTEYTFDADNPITGERSLDPDQGKPMTDIDISYVDQTFLPIAMAIDDGGQAGYMGTTLSYAEFSKRVEKFLQSSGWSSFAAYASENWDNNAFHDLIPFTHHTMGGYNLLNAVNSKASSGLYMPKPPERIAYLIEKLNVNDKQQPSNPSMSAVVARWKQWLAPNTPCAEGKAPANPAVDQTGFCQDFQTTVQWVWDQYKTFKASDPHYCQFIGSDAKPYEIGEEECLIEHIVGYKEGPDSGRLPESVQALLRGVPWNDPNSGKPSYQYNKWLLFWAPFDSSYNLNPFSGLIHDPTEGINAVAYSFSIDDKYGNFRDQGRGLIINVGGDSYLPNKTMYDPYQQYFVTWAANSWDHATVCERNVPINKRAGNSRVSMWQNGTKQNECDVIFYRPDNSHLNFKLQEENKRKVVDAHTGLAQEVQGLKMDLSYCKENSSPNLVSYCDQANLSPILHGDIAYVSLKDEEKPKTTLNVAALVTGIRLNLAPGWISATGCGLPIDASKIDPKNGSSFPLIPGAETSCSITLKGRLTEEREQQILINLNFESAGEMDPSTLSCTKADETACVGIYVDTNNINLPPPNAI